MSINKWIFRIVRIFIGREIELEVEKRSLQGMIYALKAGLFSLRLLTTVFLLLGVFVFSLMSVLQILVMTSDLGSPESQRGLVVFGVLALISGGILFFNLREKTWVKRLEIDKRVWALAEKRRSKSSPPPDTESRSREASGDRGVERVTEDMARILDRFEKRMDKRFRDLEKKVSKFSADAKAQSGDDSSVASSDEESSGDFRVRPN